MDPAPRPAPSVHVQSIDLKKIIFELCVENDKIHLNVTKYFHREKNDAQHQIDENNFHGSF